jgi:hypothetical protein
VHVADERLRAAAQVADAHGRGERAAVQLAERLHLHAAGKGREAVGDKVDGSRHERDRDEQDGLDCDDDLAPVHAAALVEANLVRDGAACREAEDGAEVVRHVLPRAGRDVHAQEQEVSGLRVGEDLVAPQKGVRVHEAAGAGEDHCEPDGLRCL